MGIYAYLEAINVLDIVKELVQATKARGTGEPSEGESSLLPLRQGERERAEYLDGQVPVYEEHQHQCPERRERRS